MLRSSSTESPRGEHLLLYDGVCGLCNRATQFVLAHDRQGLFVFASLQSDTGRALVRRFDRNPDDLDTLCVITHYQTAPALTIKSRAVLTALRHLAAPWRWLGVLGILPTPLLDWFYDRVAGSRYRIFGRYDTCPIPGPEVRGRFIDL